MIQLEEHKREIERVQALIPNARGKRRYDLQTYLKRLKKDLAKAERYLKEARTHEAIKL
jgi:septal ring factor EnvC (AmiA/AmiB activator)